MSRLSNEKLAHYKELLLQMKEDTEAEIDTERVSPNDSIQELADYGNHPGDMGTEQFEQQRDAGLEQMARERLIEIDDALSRIEEGTYGLSETSGKPIPEERLEAMPTARNLVEEEEEQQS